MFNRYFKRRVVKNPFLRITYCKVCTDITVVEKFVEGKFIKISNIYPILCSCDLDKMGYSSISMGNMILSVKNKRKECEK